MYEVREICLGGEYAFDRVDSEDLFDSFQKAKRYLNRLVKSYDNEMDYKTYLLHIIQLPINKPKQWKSKTIWEYDIKGTLIRKLDPAVDTSSTVELLDFKGKYALGDFVKVAGLPWNHFAHFKRDIIGVIAWVPETLNEWINKGNKQEDWEPLYLIDFIGQHGYHDHDHVLEQGITKFKSKLPSELIFLETLSKHYQGKLEIEKNTLNKIYKRDIFLLNVNRFEE